MTAITTEKKPLHRRGGFIVGTVAAFLALAVLITSLVLILTAAPTVYRLGGAKLREDAYSYWFSCYKHVYQVRYRELGIVDSEAGWNATDAEGVPYGESFREMIDDEIRLRFIAASLFDSEGYTLSGAEREELSTILAELEAESFGEVGYEVLKDQYGIGKNAVKQVALYEQKYAALYGRLFSDAAIIYSETYREALDTFYKTYYSRFNAIFVKDDVGADRIASLEAALFPTDGTKVSEEAFTALEKEYATDGFRVTSGNYPNGIYLYAGENYEKSFTAELLSAFAEADAVGEVAKVRNADGNGTYYVMRYALDDAPYLLDGKWVGLVFANLPNYAGAYLYRTLLRKELEKISSSGIHEEYTVAGSVGCKDYNIVQLLGNS